MTYPNIDMIQTGLHLKKCIRQAELSVKDIQKYLHLSCPQPIYRWFSGKILPSVDHLLMLSELLGVHMEDLLIKKSTEFVFYDVEQYQFYVRNKKKRSIGYYKKMYLMVA